MAYLNVRERRIETTIAYVGAELAGKSANFAHLRSDLRVGRSGTLEETSAGEGSIQSFEWRPLQMAKFDDCDVMVKLVAIDGVVADHDVHRIVADADGVVVVLDSDPAASDRNRRSVAFVKDVLAREPRARSVVVQANKCDLPDAVTGDDIARTLDVDWPLVSASAARGEGVVETLQRALNDVIETMKRKTPEETPLEATTTTVDARPSAPKTEGNPLLAALRQILQTTISEQMSVLEERVTRRLEEKVDTIGQSIATLHARVEVVSQEAREVREVIESQDRQDRQDWQSPAVTSPPPIPQELIRIPQDVLELRDDLVRVERAVEQVRSAIVEAAQDNARALRGHEEALSRVEELASRRDDDALARVVGLIEASASRVEEMHVMSLGAATREDLIGFEERARAAAEALSKHDRDHVSAAASVLRRAVEAVAVDARDTKAEIKEQKAESTRELKKPETPDASRLLVERIESVSGKTEAVLGLLEPTASGVRAIPVRLDDIEGRLQREIRGDFAKRLAPIDDAMRHLQADTMTALARVDERSTALEAGLTELITELKQRKKGWFG